MKKLMLASVMAVMAVHGACHADYSLAANEDALKKLKEICEKKSDTFIWVEADARCIPKDACNAGEQYGRYCDTSFESVRVGTEEDAKKLAKHVYKLRKFDSSCEKIGDTSITCYDKKGGYTVFPFASLAEVYTNKANLAYNTALCKLYGGELVYGEEAAVRTCGATSGYICSRVSNENPSISFDMFKKACKDIKGEGDALSVNEVRGGIENDSEGSSGHAATCSLTPYDICVINYN